MYRIFDAHCHIYPDAIAPKAVEGIDRFYGGIRFQHYDGTTETLLRNGREAGITHFLVHSVATTPHQVSGINRYIAAEAAASDGVFTGLGTLHPDSKQIRRGFYRAGHAAPGFEAAGAGLCGADRAGAEGGQAAPGLPAL